MHPIKFFFLFVFFYTPLLVAQEFKCIHFGTDKGLPSSEVYDILQDKKGYMWFATDHGVAKYNGKEFQTYTTADGLSDNCVFRMCEDKKGRIWFGSQNNELCYIEHDTIHRAAVSNLLRQRIKPHYAIKNLYVDSLFNIWITSGYSYFLDAKSKYTTLVQLSSDTCLLELRIIDNKIVIPSASKKISISNFSTPEYSFQVKYYSTPNNITYENNTVKKDIIRPVKDFPAVYLKKNDILFYAAGNILFVLKKNEKTKTYVFKNTILNLTLDSKNGLWVNLLKGGTCYYKNADLSRPSVNLLTQYSVDAVCMDHEGGVWIATLEKGVFYVPSTSIFIYPAASYLNDRITFIGNVNDQLYINTFGNIICKEENGAFTPVPFLCALVKKKSLLYNIKCINDTVYCSYFQEIVRFTSSFKLIKGNPPPDHFYAGGKDIMETADHSVWLLHGSGLKKLYNKTQTTETFLSAFRATCALPQENNILIGGKDGLYLFKNKKYESLAYIDPLLKCQIIDMARSADGSIWLATIGNGVLRLHHNKVTQWKVSDGLISNICTTIAIDQYNNVWVGSNKGINCLKPGNKNNWRIKHVREKNGLISDEITKLFAFGNSLWVGTMSGICRIDIFETLQIFPPPYSYITAVDVNNKNIPLTKHVFSHLENNFKFRMDALTFINPSTRYRYRLIGLDTSWQETKTDELLMNNLAPGKYTYEVKGSNMDGNYSKNAASFSFIIQKPFWSTWWFILFEIILLIVLIYLIIRSCTNIIRKKEQEKVRINKLLAEYQMKALTAQMNPHFIFNAINSIQNFIIQNHATLAYDYLVKFSKLIRLVLVNSKENEITLQQEIDTLLLYIELEQLRFENSFEFQLSIDPEIDTEQIMIPALLPQPYIENAIWHGLMPLKNRKGIIALSFKIIDGLLHIRITDNGVGRAASNLIEKKIHRKGHQSVGMELTGKRVELFGKDTISSLKIIDNFNDQQEPTGTTVEIILPIIENY